MNGMFAPGLTRTGYARFEGHPKFYRAEFRWRNVTRFSLVAFRRASAAEQYALAVMMRYERLLKAMKETA